MLTKLSPVISTAILAAGATVAVGTTPAFADPVVGGPGGKGGVFLGGKQRQTIGGPAHSGGGKPGKRATAQCPTGLLVACKTLGNAVPAAAPVRTIDVAYEARDQLQLPTPTVHTSPENRTYVALRTGLWLGNGIYARKTVSVTDGATTVTAIGEPRSVTWNMGESTVTCHSRGSKDGKACGYTYQRSSAGQPNRRYAISVTVTWYVHWTCEGTCDAPAGDWAPNSTMSRTTNTTLAVGEVQTESRPG
jgi:hypothetical protein